MMNNILLYLAIGLGLLLSIVAIALSLKKRVVNQIISNTQNELPFPAMTTDGRNNIINPVVGTGIYNLSTSSYNYFDGSRWVELADLSKPQTLSNKTLVSSILNSPTLNSPTLNSPLLTTPSLGVAKGTSLALGTENVNSNAILDINSQDKGIILPKLTTASRLRLTSPVNGLSVYDTDYQAPSYYNGTNWFVPSYVFFKAGVDQIISGNGAPVVTYNNVTQNDNRIRYNNGAFVLLDAGVYSVDFSGTFELPAGSSERLVWVDMIYKPDATERSIAVSSDQIANAENDANRGSCSVTYVGEFNANSAIMFRVGSGTEGNAVLLHDTHGKIIRLK